MLQNKFSTKFRKIPSGAENKKMKIKSIPKPNCSMIILVSVRSGRTEKSSFDPSRGGIGIRLKKAKRVFQKTTMIKTSKNIAPNDPGITEETAFQLLKLLIISTLSATGKVINLAEIAKTREITILDTGPARATIAGPHF